MLPNELITTLHINTNTNDALTCKLVASIHTIRFRYLGEVIAEHEFESNKDITQTLLEGKKYKIQLLDKRSRILNEFDLKAKDKISIMISEDKITLNN
jgi:hypothetical protein